MTYVELDPAIARKAIEGYENELAPEQKALDAFYRQFRCKRCGSACHKQMLARHAFADPDTLVPRALLRCGRCRCLFDPHTGIVLELGNPAHAAPDLLLVGGEEARRAGGEAGRRSV